LRHELRNPSPVHGSPFEFVRIVMPRLGVSSRAALRTLATGIVTGFRSWTA
jgi:hypothetical protein